MTAWNTGIIEEFRENGGKVGGRFEGAPLLLLHSTGAKSGKPRLAPLRYRAVDEDFAVFGSKRGADTHPDWYYNLIANPLASIEVGTETIEVTARVAEGDERSLIWELQKSEVPIFAEYEQQTPREIPVILLEPQT
jgi:deazaflavin-dependent oxidoreductase (nitroreductase family)